MVVSISTAAGVLGRYVLVLHLQSSGSYGLLHAGSPTGTTGRWRASPVLRPLGNSPLSQAVIYAGAGHTVVDLLACVLVHFLQYSSRHLVDGDMLGW